MKSQKSSRETKMGWLPILGGIIIAGSIFTAYALLFKNQKIAAPTSSTDVQNGSDTEGVVYIINRDTLVENGQCRVKILQVIVKKNTVLLYFSLENHFKSNILDIIPYIIDLDNEGKVTRNTNTQQFVGTTVEPNQIGTLVGEFDYSVGTSRHFKFGFRFLAKGMTGDGDVSVPFEVKSER